MHDNFNYVKKGYDPISVDAYVDSMEASLKAYTEKEATINKAIISAQASADILINNAQNTADNIILNAKTQARDMLKNYEGQVSDLMKLLNTQRHFLKNFQQEYNMLVSKYLRDIGDTDIAILYNTIDNMEENLRNFLAGEQ